MTEIIKHAIQIKTKQDMSDSPDTFTGCVTTSYLIDRPTYTTDPDGTKIEGELVSSWLASNLATFKKEAQDNPHKLEDLQKGDQTGWCPACFNRVCDGIGQPNEKI